MADRNTKRCLVAAVKLLTEVSDRAARNERIPANLEDRINAFVLKWRRDHDDNE